MTTRSILLCLAVAIGLVAVALFVWPGLLGGDEPSGIIVFQGADDDGYGIFTVPARGGRVQPLPIATDSSAGFPRYSPDGRSIAYVAEDSTGTEDLFVSDADGRNVRSLAPSPGQPEGAPAWSPDGSSIVFATRRDGDWEIYAVRADGSALTRLTNDPAFDSSPVFSPDGGAIAFTSDRGDPEEDSHVFRMNVDGTGVRQITSGEDESVPDFSPDGRRIAYVGFTGGNADIWISQTDGSAPERITSAEMFEHTPRWSPDGRWIAYEGYVERFPDLYLMRSDGSGPRRLTNTGGYAGAPAWRPEPRS
jgi:TolB protein